MGGDAPVLFQRCCCVRVITEEKSYVAVASSLHSPCYSANLKKLPKSLEPTHSKEILLNGGSRHVRS
jgi:hypothetical protein